MYLCKFGQNSSSSSEDNARKTIFWTFQSATVTLRIGSRSPKSNQLFPSSQQCIHASLVKNHQLLQKIMHGNESGGRRQHQRRQDPHQKQFIPPPSGLGGHNKNKRL